MHRDIQEDVLNTAKHASYPGVGRNKHGRIRPEHQMPSRCGNLEVVELSKGRREMHEAPGSLEGQRVA